MPYRFCKINKKHILATAFYFTQYFLFRFSMAVNLKLMWGGISLGLGLALLIAGTTLLAYQIGKYNLTTTWPCQYTFNTCYVDDVIIILWHLTNV